MKKFEKRKKKEVAKGGLLISFCGDSRELIRRLERRRTSRYCYALANAGAQNCDICYQAYRARCAGKKG